MPWFWKGLRSPVSTLSKGADKLPVGVTPGRPVATALPNGQSFQPEICPTAALDVADGMIRVDLDRCIHCLRCQGSEPPVDWTPDYQWAQAASPPLPRPFRSSLHVRVIDAGDCGACLNEVRQLTGPVYSLHRFGIYITPTPRDADVLLVVGPVTVGMAVALEESYNAMPEPKRVVAVGVCAINGGLFQDSFAVKGGAHQVIPVDVTVPGCPPPPLAILHALSLVTGQARMEMEGVAP